MRFYYFDISLLYPTRLLKNLGKSFSGGRPGGGGCVGDKGGREQDFWELGKVWAGTRSREGMMRMGEPSKGWGRQPGSGTSWRGPEARGQGDLRSLRLRINHMQMRCKNNVPLFRYYFELEAQAVGSKEQIQDLV